VKASVCSGVGGTVVVVVVVDDVVVVGTVVDDVVGTVVDVVVVDVLDVVDVVDVVVVGSNCVTEVMVTSTVTRRIDGCSATASLRGAVPVGLSVAGCDCTFMMNDTRLSPTTKCFSDIAVLAPSARFTVS
jgi:hypothetical protein